MSDFNDGLASEPYFGPPAYIVVERGPTPDKRYELTAVTNTIGRSPGNEITINDPEISRRHAQIVVQGQGFAIEDLGSTNGTFVNGQRCAGRTPLRHGDRIEFGDTVSLHFYTAVPQPAAPPAAMPRPAPRLDEEDTADLPPVKAPPRYPTAVDPYQSAYPAQEQAGGRSNRLLLGCVLLAVLLLCACGLLTFFLDSYNQGQYLYCGGLRPLWEMVLGPLGFNPICP
jgi:hypothetical protein